VDELPSDGAADMPPGSRIGEAECRCNCDCRERGTSGKQSNWEPNVADGRRRVEPTRHPPAL